MSLRIHICYQHSTYVYACRPCAQFLARAQGPACAMQSVHVIFSDGDWHKMNDHVHLSTAEYEPDYSSRPHTINGRYPCGHVAATLHYDTASKSRLVKLRQCIQWDCSWECTGSTKHVLLEDACKPASATSLMTAVSVAQENFLMPGEKSKNFA